jgi:hypothetical protein
MEALMEELRWPIEYDTEGNIVDVEFNGEKYWDDEVIFEAIAPFVKDGSYIQMQGEDGERWRWVFWNGRMRQITSHVLWDYCEGCSHKALNGPCTRVGIGLNDLFGNTCDRGSGWEQGIQHRPNITRDNDTPVHKAGFHS